MTQPFGPRPGARWLIGVEDGAYHFSPRNDEARTEAEDHPDGPPPWMLELVETAESLESDVKRARRKAEAQWN